MKGLLFFTLLFVTATWAQLEDDYDLPEEWQDYDNFYDYGMIKEETEKLLPKSEEDIKIDQKVQNDIEKYKNEEAGFHDLDNSYQIEDNRSNNDQNIEEKNEETSSEDLKDKLAEKEARDNDYSLLWGDNKVKDTKSVKEESQEETVKKDEESVIDEVIDKDPKAGADNDYHLLWGDDDMAPLPIPDEEDNILDESDKIFADDEKEDFDDAIPAISAEKVDDKILKETLELLKEDEKEGNDLDDLPLPVPNEDLNQDLLEETKTILKDVDNIDSVPQDFKQNIEDIVDETKKLLEEGNSPNEENIPESKEDLEDEISKLANEIDKAQDRLDNADGDDDTVDDAMNDLNDDLDKLFDTLDKLKEGIEETNDKVQDKIEEVFGSNGDDLFDDFNDDDDVYQNIGDSNLSEILGKLSTTHSDNDSKEDDYEDVGQEDLDEVVKEILEEEDKINNSKEREISNETEEDASNIDDKIESMQADAEEKPIMYENDALLDGDSKQDDSIVEQFDADDLISNEKVDKDMKNQEAAQRDEESDKSNENEIKPSTKMVEDLNSEELDALMEQFKLVHSDEMQIKSESAPIHIKLSVDEPVVITSPNYPNPYPTNNIIDWMFEGDGMGIELIIEDFAVNGALGDYLLVKPGGVDASGREGLVFSYHLNSERRYRFMDVNRMFVRFEAKMGMMLRRGFKFTVKMISPPRAFEHIRPPPEDPVVRYEDNLTVILGGLSIIDFRDIKEDFRVILADMAERYILENDVDPGLNTTYEVTSIVKTAVCNVRWPNYENCVEVTFSVPLRYENETEERRLNQTELREMWQTLFHAEPFASQFDKLGIVEFSVPNSRAAMTAWTIIAFGVLISVAMLAVALWRFSCFEDYTRMRAFNDSDSVSNEKRNLDLYPTPHQTLPPLFAESEYKWHDDKYDGSTRVDLGGYANRSYVRDEMFGFDSDEDVVPARERGPVISPRDIYSGV